MADVVSNSINLLHNQSMQETELLQTSFQSSENLVMSISTLLISQYAFLSYMPLWFTLDERVRKRIVIALTLSDLTSQILEWLLIGERPGCYAEKRAEELGQPTNASLFSTNIEPYDAALLLAAPQLTESRLPIICKRGAGLPSDSALVIAAVWYILIHAQLHSKWPPLSRANYAEDAIGRSAGKLSRLWCWVYKLILILVSLTHVFMVCHFPHQCVSGALLGVAVAWLVCERLPMQMLRRRYFNLAATFILANFFVMRYLTL